MTWCTWKRGRVKKLRPVSTEPAASYPMPKRNAHTVNRWLDFVQLHCFAG